MMHQNYTHTQDNQTQDIPREKNRRLKLNKYKVVISKSANHYIDAACQPYLRIFPLKVPFLVTLELPRFTKGQFPPKIPRPAGQTKF
jgi:hypothetical protein